MVPEVACKVLKEPADTFRTDVFVITVCKVLIVPVVDCRVVMVPEVDCKLLKEPVDTFRTDVFVITDCKVLIVPLVDCKLLMVPEVACKELKEPVDTFRTDVFVITDCKVVIFPVEAFKSDVLVFETNTLFINVFIHAVVGILEELSVFDKNDIIFGLYKNVAVDTFKTEVFVVLDCKVLIVPLVACKLLIVPEVACKELK